jgi:hypothetical protein
LIAYIYGGPVQFIRSGSSIHTPAGQEELLFDIMAKHKKELNTTLEEMWKDRK